MTTSRPVSDDAIAGTETSRDAPGQHRPVIEIRIQGRRVTDSAWRLRRSRDLIKMLALAPNRRLQRDIVLDRLWPDLNPKAAANNF
ncbi:MAG: hypothetical protein ACOC9Y_00355 [Chloroflexota bacterium]